MSIHYKTQNIIFKIKSSVLFYSPLLSVIPEDNRKMFSNRDYPQNDHSDYYLCMRNPRFRSTTVTNQDIRK